MPEVTDIAQRSKSEWEPQEMQDWLKKVLLQVPPEGKTADLENSNLETTLWEGFQDDYDPPVPSAAVAQARELHGYLQTHASGYMLPGGACLTALSELLGSSSCAVEGGGYVTGLVAASPVRVVLAAFGQHVSSHVALVRSLQPEPGLKCLGRENRCRLSRIAPLSILM